jgi:polyphenol oxidase
MFDICNYWHKLFFYVNTIFSWGRTFSIEYPIVLISLYKDPVLLYLKRYLINLFCKRRGRFGKGGYMIEKCAGSLTILSFNNLLAHRTIRHFVSTRTGGFSEFPYDSLNLGLHVGDDPDTVVKNRERFAEAVRIPLDQFTIARQIHSGNVRVVSDRLRGSGSTDQENAVADTDAMVTDTPGICLIVLVADCVPLLFFDPSRRAIGVAHAGWRGTLKSIASHTVSAMKEAFSSSPGDIMVGIGPSIGPCCYRIGPDVISQVKSVFRGRNNFIVNESKGGEGYLDLWKANLEVLLRAGIERKNIEIAGRCTCHEPGLFFSYRNQKGDTGRFAAGIMLLRS